MRRHPLPETDDRPPSIIVGGPLASGKETLAEWLAEEFRSRADDIMKLEAPIDGDHPDF
jgi:polynucleotide 5'-kinase involved in rRNA processing